LRLKRLAAQGFRNLEPVDLDTDARFVVFHGDNAQGKTNAVEAVYFLSTLRPLRARRYRDLIRWGSRSGAVAGQVEQGGLTRSYRIDLDEGGRRVQLDGKRVTDLSEYFAGIRAIAFTPRDVAIVGDAPKVRRRWIDRAAFTARPAHLDVVRSFRRTLEQKGAALRSQDVDRALLDVLDEQLAITGGDLVERRVRMLEELEPHVQGVYAEIAGASGSLTLHYRTEASGETQQERKHALRERLAARRAEALRRGRTLVGPQGDEIIIELNGKPARIFGSQGQVRSVVLALKLGELMAAHARGEAPLFLLDDVSSELDAHRTRRLVAVLEELGSQVFATTTDVTHLAILPSEDTLRVRVEQGVLGP
jgi:DNA replication and repair protein RecF